MLKMGFSAKLSLKRIQKKHLHRLTDTVRSRVVCWFLYSQELFLIVYSDWILSNWSSCSHNLIASKETDLKQENFLYFAIPLTSFRLPSSAVLLAVHRLCSAHAFLARGSRLNHTPNIRTVCIVRLVRLEKKIIRNSRKFSDYRAFSFLDLFRLPGI